MNNNRDEKQEDENCNTHIAFANSFSLPIQNNLRKAINITHLTICAPVLLLPQHTHPNLHLHLPISPPHSPNNPHLREYPIPALLIHAPNARPPTSLLR